MTHLQDIQEREKIREATENANQPNLIDFKRILFLAWRFWYVVVLSLTVAFVIAFYKNRYTEKLYPVTASIIIREQEETNGAEILYKNSLVDQYRNYLNEPYIIRSYPLITEVIKENNFNIAFYQKGYIRTTEAYKTLPFRAAILNTGALQPCRFNFTWVDSTRYMLEGINSTKFPKTTGVLGETVKAAGNDIRIERIPGKHLRDEVGKPYVLAIKNPEAMVSEYVNRLDISWAEEGAGVINLRIVGPIPAKDIDFVNSLINHYQMNDLAKKNQTADKTVTFIEGQLNKISDSLKLFEGQLQRFKSDNRTSGDLGGEAERAMQRIDALQSQRAELLVRAKYYEYLLGHIQSNKELDQIIVPTSFGINDPLINSHVSKIVDLQLELKVFMDREKVSNPLVNSKLSRLNTMKKEIVESIEQLRIADGIKMNHLDKQVAKEEKALGLLPSAERQLVSIRRNYSLLENLYVFLMQKMSEAEISKASNASDILVVNPALQAGGSTTPKNSQNFTWALVLGLGIPFMVFVLIEFFNTKVQSKEDIEKITTIPFIVGVGHKKSLDNLEVLNSPKSAIAESFRALRSNLNYFVDSKSRPVFLVTSSISGEGKTFTTVNLASIFALSGKKTLIVGADMRKPKLYQEFGLTNDRGLSTYLSGMHSFEEVIQKTSSPHLDMTSGGPVPPNPSELLLNGRIEEFVQQARSLYEYVIIDTPPMAIVTDAFVLSPLANHTLFIVRQNYTPKVLIKTANEFYHSGKVKNMSIVLNDIYKTGPGYGYGYGSGYEYYMYGYGYSYGRGKNGYGYYS